MGSLSGTITIVSLASGTCSIAIADGNGSSQTIAITTTVTGSMAELSSSLSHSQNSYAMISGPDGNVWVTEGSGYLAKIVPSTGAVTEYNIGTSLAANITSINLANMAIGSDGNLWITYWYTSSTAGQASGVVGVSTSGTVVHQYPAPGSTIFGVYGPIVATTGGLVISVDARGIGGELGTVNISTGAYTLGCEIYNGGAGSNTSSLGATQMGVSPDGNTVYALVPDNQGSNSSNDDALYQVATAAGGCSANSATAFTNAYTPRYNNGDPFAGSGGATFSIGPGFTDVAVTSSGAIYVVLSTPSEQSENAQPSDPTIIAQMGAYNYYTVTGNARGIAVGPDGNLWIASNWNGIGAIVKAVPTFTSSSTYSTTTGTTNLSSIPVAIGAGSDGNVWFIEANGKIGRISP